MPSAGFASSRSPVRYEQAFGTLPAGTPKPGLWGAARMPLAGAGRASGPYCLAGKGEELLCDGCDDRHREGRAEPAARGQGVLPPGGWWSRPSSTAARWPAGCGARSASCTASPPGSGCCQPAVCTPVRGIWCGWNATAVCWPAAPVWLTGRGGRFGDCRRRLSRELVVMLPRRGGGRSWPTGR